MKRSGPRRLAEERHDRKDVFRRLDASGGSLAGGAIIPLKQRVVDKRDGPLQGLLRRLRRR